MTDNRLPKKIHEWISTGRINSGRPKLTQIQGMFQIERKRGLVDEASEGRDKFRVLINS